MVARATVLSSVKVETPFYTGRTRSKTRVAYFIITTKTDGLKK